jgi:hypothetical protein
MEPKLLGYKYRLLQLTHTLFRITFIYLKVITNFGEIPVIASKLDSADRLKDSLSI